MALSIGSFSFTRTPDIPRFTPSQQEHSGAIANGSASVWKSFARVNHTSRPSRSVAERLETKEPFGEIREDPVDAGAHHLLRLSDFVDGPDADLEASAMRALHALRRDEPALGMKRFGVERACELDSGFPVAVAIEDHAEPSVRRQLAQTAQALRGEGGKNRLLENTAFRSDTERDELETARIIVALELEVQADAARERFDRFLERRDLLALEGRRKPGAGVELLHLAKRARANGPAPVRRAVEALVVEKNGGSIERELAVDLDHVGAELDRANERSARVLRAVSGRAAMTDAKKRGKLFHAATLAPRSESWHDRSVRRWLEIAVVVPTSAVDAVANRLVESGAPGIVEEEVRDDPARARVVAHFENANAAGSVQRILAELEPYFPGVASAPLETRLVDEENWAEGWRQAFPPLEIGRRLRVRPPWERAASDGRADVVIEPAMAFGTGQHASTHGCLLALEEHAAPGGTVLDVGTGSGILAIAAVALGAVSVVAVDTDPIAVAAARSNAFANAVAERIRFAVGGVECVRGAYELAVANLYSGVLAELLPALICRLERQGALVLSGLLASDAPALGRRAGECGLRLVGERTIDGWTTLVYRRSDVAAP